MDEQIERFLNTCRRYAAMPDSERKKATMSFLIGQASKLNTVRKEMMRDLDEQDFWLLDHPRDKRRTKFDDYWTADIKRYEALEKALNDGAAIAFGESDHATRYERPYYRTDSAHGADAGGGIRHKV